MLIPSYAGGRLQVSRATQVDEFTATVGTGFAVGRFEPGTAVETFVSARSGLNAIRAHVYLYQELIINLFPNTPNSVLIRIEEIWLNECILDVK